ncbi:MAG TPA: SMP-30/gluconolactonase/LRE family protein, partial [Dehalococcoidia bacterium]|nr:SMP-30/gluconolactonase/LRE family protein [Dehalococcoidia bacterium]
MAIVAFDNRLGELVDPDARIEQIASGFEFTEGPVWHHRDRTLIFSDVRGGSMYRWTEGSVEVFRRPSGGGNGNTYDA